MGMLVAGWLGLSALSGCVIADYNGDPASDVPTAPPPAPTFEPVDPIVASVTPMARPPVETTPPVPPVRSALAIHYQRLQNDLLSRGLMRTDSRGEDAQFTDTMLARNFVQIALYDEYTRRGDSLRAEQTESRLRRWEQPIRFAIQFGETIPREQEATDRAEIQTYISRLSDITGHPMRVSDVNPNFYVLVLNETDRLQAASALYELIPGIDQASINAFRAIPRDTLCLVLAFSEGDSPTYSRAVALIRGEHPDLMRLACIHEELAQGLGLANDSPQARPSIFNDDEEFALLTHHDELLLKMLYDPRLQSGMTVDEATPIARQIATDLMSGNT